VPAIVERAVGVDQRREAAPAGAGAARDDDDAMPGLVLEEHEQRRPARAAPVASRRGPIHRERRDDAAQLAAHGAVEIEARR